MKLNSQTGNLMVECFPTNFSNAGFNENSRHMSYVFMKLTVRGYFHTNSQPIKAP